MKNWRTKDVLTVDQVANILEVDRRIVYDTIHAGELHAVTVGSRILRVPVSSLRIYLGEIPNPIPTGQPEAILTPLRAVDEGS